jgi:hypothetical protein
MLTQYQITNFQQINSDAFRVFGIQDERIKVGFGIIPTHDG